MNSLALSSITAPAAPPAFSSFLAFAPDAVVAEASFAVTTPVHVAAPFDWAHTRAFVDGFSPMAGEQNVGAGHLTKAVSIGGTPVVFRLRPRGDRERPSFSAELFSSEPLTPSERQAVLTRVAAYLATDDDLDAFYAVAATDRAFAPLARSYRGLRHVRFPTPFEAACWAVLNQRIPMAQARRMKDALTVRAGAALAVEGVVYRAFPEPEAIAAIDERELAEMLPGGHRAAAVAALARAFSGLDPRFLREAPLEDARAWLEAIHGVGPFTSSFTLYRGLGRFAGAAIIAPRLVQAASEQYGRTLTASDVQRLAASYGPWGGHWMLYLWASTFIPPARDTEPALRNDPLLHWASVG